MAASQLTLEPRFYEQAVETWSGELVQVVSLDGKAIARIPIDFLARGGDNTWSYVIHVVHQLVLEREGSIYQDGVSVHPELAPLPGIYIYDVPGFTSVHFSPGPTLTTPYKPADVEGSTDTGRSSTPTNNQLDFRGMVRARDIHCLISGEFMLDCEAVHIVPKDREAVYRDLLKLRENEPVGQKFSASAGILLEPKLRKAFDRLEMSFYYKEGVMYAHFFRVGLQDSSRWHGIAIPSTRFHIPYPQYWPKPEYLQWHYRQCLLARFRGFSA